jgi:FkbM family methyltransferase
MAAELLYESAKILREDGVGRFLIETWVFVLDRLADILPASIHEYIVILFWLPFGVILKRPQTSLSYVYQLRNISSGETFQFPQLNQHKRYRSRYFELMRSVYFDSNHAPIENDDIVVDVGAFLGVSTMAAAERASSVLAIEPSPRSFSSLEHNISSVECIIPVHCAAADYNGDIDLNLGYSASDDSVLAPDTPGAGEAVRVPAKTIDCIASENGLEHIDLLKIEAEGYEIEVLEGVQTTPVNKIIVNCDPERDGESPWRQIEKELRKRGYDVVSEDGHYRILFAKLLSE